MVVKNKNTKVRTFSYKNKEYDLTKGEEIEKLYSTLTPKLTNIIDQVEPYKPITVTEDKNLFPCRVGKFYINKGLFTHISTRFNWNTVSEVNALIKLAAYDQSINTPLGLADHIYTPDKDQYLDARVRYHDIPDTTIDALSRHRCGKEVKNNTYIYRHFGTPEGQLLFRKIVLSHNLKLLHWVFYGSKDEPFKCASTGQLLENVGYYGFPEDLRIYTAKVPLHHVLVYDRESVRKTRIAKGKKRIKKDPSKILVTYFLDNPDNQEYLLDIMGTLPLSSDQHGYCHSLPHSDIKMHTNLQHMPLHMSSKKHFNRVKKRLNLRVTYEEFMHSLTFESIGVNREEVLKDLRRTVQKSNNFDN